MASQVSQDQVEVNHKRKDTATNSDKEAEYKEIKEYSRYVVRPAQETQLTPHAGATTPTPIDMSSVPNNSAEISPFVLLLANTKVESIWTRESKVKIISLPHQTE